MVMRLSYLRDERNVFTRRHTATQHHKNLLLQEKYNIKILKKQGGTFLWPPGIIS